MKIRCVKPGIVAILALSLVGCIVNPTPNAGAFAMTEAQTKAAQFNALQTQNIDREAHRGKLRDEAEARAWERNISVPYTTVVVPSRY